MRRYDSTAITETFADDQNSVLMKPYEINTPPQMFGEPAPFRINPMFDTSVEIERPVVKQRYKTPMPDDTSKFKLDTFIKPIIDQLKKQVSSLGNTMQNIDDATYKDQIETFCTLWRTKVEEQIRKEGYSEDQQDSYTRWADEVVRIYTSDSPIDTDLRMMTFTTPSQGLKAFVSVVQHSVRARNGAQEMNIKKRPHDLKHSWDVRASVIDPMAQSIISKLENEAKASKNSYWAAVSKSQSEIHPVSSGPRSVSDPWWFSIPRNAYRSTWQNMKNAARENAGTRFSARCAWLTDILQRPPPATADDTRSAVEIITTYGLNRISINDTRAIQHQFGPCSAAERGGEATPEKLNIERFSALRDILFNITSPVFDETNREGYKPLREHCTVAPHAPGVGSHSQVKYIQQQIIPAFCDTFSLAMLKIPEPLQYEFAESTYSRFALAAQGITDQGQGMLLDVMPIWREMIGIAKRTTKTTLQNPESPDAKAMQPCLEYLGFCARFIWETPKYQGSKGRWKLSHTAIWLPDQDNIENLSQKSSSSPYRFFPRMEQTVDLDGKSALDALEGLIRLTQKGRYADIFRSAATEPRRRWPLDGVTCPELDKITAYLKADGQAPRTALKNDARKPKCQVTEGNLKKLKALYEDNDPEDGNRLVPSEALNKKIATTQRTIDDYKRKHDVLQSRMRTAEGADKAALEADLEEVEEVENTLVKLTTRKENFEKQLEYHVVNPGKAVDDPTRLSDLKTQYYVIPGMPDNTTGLGHLPFEIEKTSHDEYLFTWNNGFPKDQMMHTANKVNYYDRLVRSAEKMTDISTCNLLRCPYRMVQPTIAKQDDVRPAMLKDTLDYLGSNY